MLKKHILTVAFCLGLAGIGASFGQTTPYNPQVTPPGVPNANGLPNSTSMLDAGYVTNPTPMPGTTGTGGSGLVGFDAGTFTVPPPLGLVPDSGMPF